MFPLFLQVHSYLSSNKGSDCVHSVPSQANHCWGLGLYLCVLHAVVFSRGHSGENKIFGVFLITWLKVTAVLWLQQFCQKV